jgi:hypothetical protein
MPVPKLTLISRRPDGSTDEIVFEVPTLDAGMLEDHEAAVNRYLNLPVEVPTGANMGAIVDLVTALAQRACPDKGITREQVRVAVNARNLRDVLAAIAWAFGFESKAVSPGEAVSPST